ncbi:MAG: BTAD domain-containing putative transcriptional regulator [Betaproteobacteria bacterium]
MLVFDNYQELPHESALNGIFAALVEEIPQSGNLIVISRESPPDHMARALVSEKIVLLGWEHLRLTLDETAAIASSRGTADKRTIELIAEQSDGWTAGVMLLLERMRRDGVLYAARHNDNRQGAFDYFASQIFDPTPAQARELLMAASVFSQFTIELAQAITGDPGAGQVLEFLYHRHLFVDRRTGDETVFQFHALFRVFLQHRAAQHFGEDGVAALKCKAAGLLARCGREEQAFPLLAEAAQWVEAAELFIRVAPTLIAQGRWQTARDWGAIFPEAFVGQDPRVLYWVGRARMPIEPAAVRELFEKAYLAFKASSDEVWQLLCAAAVLEAIYYDFGDFHPMAPWIEHVAELLDKVALPSPEDELRVNCALAIAATYRAPEHPLLKRCIERTCRLLERPLDANLGAAAVSVLHAYSDTMMDSEAEQTALREGARLLKSPDLTPPRAAFLLSSAGYTHYLFGRYGEAWDLLERAGTIAAEHGLEQWALLSGSWLGLVQRRSKQLDKAEQTIARLLLLRRPRSGHRIAVFEFLQGVVAFDRGRAGEGLEYVLKSYASMEGSGQFLGLMLVGLGATNMFVAAGRFDDARAQLDKLRAMICGPRSTHFLPAVLINAAWLAHRLGRGEERDALLREALQGAGDRRARLRLPWYANALSEMLPLAVTRSIEQNTALELVRELGIDATETTATEWPWRVRIFALGKFELLLDGKEPNFSRKPPRRTLAVLQVLIACGGRDVPESRIIEALWPDDDGDAAHGALSTALHRLRKILNVPDAIRQSQGKLSLDPRRCWVDVWAFEKKLVDREPSASEDSGDDLLEALALYRGAFLAQEDEASWAVSARERLRGKFLRAVGRATRGLEAARQFEAAIDLYLRGLDADILAEAFYQGLMRCNAQLDRRTEIVSVYRRLEQVLSVSLGARPSHTTDRLYLQLKTAVASGH